MYAIRSYYADVGTMSGTGFSQSGEATVSMSVDFADFNGDGLLDMFISDDTYCSLYENLGDGVFSDKSYIAGISVPSGQFVGWSSSFLDYVITSYSIHYTKLYEDLCGRALPGLA